MPTINPRLQAIALDAEIDALTHAFRPEWVFLEPSPSGYGKMVRSLKPQFAKEYASLQAKIVSLQERKTELEREISKGVSIYA